MLLLYFDILIKVNSHKKVNFRIIYFVFGAQNSNSQKYMKMIMNKISSLVCGYNDKYDILNLKIV